MTKTASIVIALVSGLVAIGAIFWASYENQIATNRIIKAVSEIKRIGLNDNFPQFLEDSASNGIDGELSATRDLLQSAASRVQSLKLSITGLAATAQTSNQISEASSALDAANSRLAEIERTSREMLQAHSEFITAWAQMQARYEARIESLEREINTIESSGSKISFEFIVAVVGVITAISSLLIAWRRDSREVVELRLALSEASSSTS